jgi:hypothetical protein
MEGDWESGTGCGEVGSGTLLANTPEKVREALRRPSYKLPFRGTWAIGVDGRDSSSGIVGCVAVASVIFSGGKRMAPSRGPPSGPRKTDRIAPEW